MGDLPLDFMQGKVPKLLEDGHEPVEWPADPALEWAPPGHGDVYSSLRTSGMLERAARRRLPLPVPVELRQPRRGARAAHPRLVRARGAALPVGVDRPYRGRSQGRPPGSAGADGGLVLRETAQTPDEDRGGVRGHRAPPLLQLQQHLGRPRGPRAQARRARRRARPADDRQPQDGRPQRLLVARRGAARDRDGRGDRGVRGGGGDPRAARALRARSRPPTTCSSCARTPTSWPTTAACDLAARTRARGRSRFRALQAAGRLRAALPGRAALAGGLRAPQRGGRRALRRGRDGARRGDRSRGRARSPRASCSRAETAP